MQGHVCVCKTEGHVCACMHTQVLVEAETPDGIRHSTLLQNAETVRLIGPSEEPNALSQHQNTDTATASTRARQHAESAANGAQQLQGSFREAGRHAGDITQAAASPAEGDSVAASSLSNASSRRANATVKGQDALKGSDVDGSASVESVQSNIAHLALAMADGISTSLADLPVVKGRKGSKSRTSGEPNAWVPLMSLGGAAADSASGGGTSSSGADSSSLTSNIAVLAAAAVAGGAFSASPDNESSPDAESSPPSSQSASLTPSHPHTLTAKAHADTGTGNGNTVTIHSKHSHSSDSGRNNGGSNRDSGAITSGSARSPSALSRDGSSEVKADADVAAGLTQRVPAEQDNDAGAARSQSGSQWKALAVSQIRVGDRVWLLRQDPARHTGISIQERITEK